MGYPRKPAFWIPAAAFTLYFVLIFSRYGQIPFLQDTVYNVWRARKIVGNPLSIFRPDDMGRFGILYTPFFFLMDRFFGFNPWAYGLVNGFLYLLNVFLLFRLLCCLIESSKMPAVLASVFFLFSGAQWDVRDFSQIMRLASASLFLLSLLFFVRFVLTKKKIDFVFSWVFFLLSFGFIEDAVTLPLLLLIILFLFSPKGISWIEKFILTSPFFLVSLMVTWLSFSAGGPQRWGLGIGRRMFINFLSLIKNLGKFLLIPRPEFVPLPGSLGILLRLLPVFLIASFAGILWRWKKDQILDSFRQSYVGRCLIFGIAWMGITSLPYLLLPTWVWQQGVDPYLYFPKYLYFPGMGEAIVVGVLLYLVGRSLKAPDRRIPLGVQRFLRGGCLGIIFYGLMLNVSTTFLAGVVPREMKVATQEEIPVIFSLVSAIRDQFGAPLEMPPHTILVVEGLPFSISRLRELLPTYYISAPLMIIEARQGRPLKNFPHEKNQRILYFKWGKGAKVSEGTPAHIID